MNKPNEVKLDQDCTTSVVFSEYNKHPFAKSAASCNVYSFSYCLVNIHEVSHHNYLCFYLETGLVLFGSDAHKTSIVCKEVAVLNCL